MIQNKKIGLYIMSEKGLAVLQAIVSEIGPKCIDFVVSAKDKHMKKDWFREIQAEAKKAGTLFYAWPQRPRKAKSACIAVSWRWLLPPDTHSPLIVLHDSLLPKYRGFGPLVTALVSGDKKIGVTALLAVSEPDRGPIIGQVARTVRYPITIKQAIQKTIPCYRTLALQVVRKVFGNKMFPRPQNEKKATYSLWRDEQDYKIDWSLRSEQVRRFVDAVGFPYLGAVTFLQGQKMRLLACQEFKDVVIANRTPGKIIQLINGYPIVVCGSGLIKVTCLVSDETGQSVLPLHKTRLRFSN